MKAEYNERLDLYRLIDNQSAPQFLRFCGSFGWLNPKGDEHEAEHWAVVAGLTEAREVVFIDHHHGLLDELCEWMTDQKDLLLVEAIFSDFRDFALIQKIEDWDGLCKYEVGEVDVFGMEQYLHEPSHWRHYRSRECLAHLVPVSERLLKNPQIAAENLRSHIAKEKTRATDKCGRLRWLLSQDIKEVWSHPLFRATLYLHEGLLESVITIQPNTQKRDWIGNLKRREL